MIFALNSPIASAASLSLAAQFGLVGVWSEIWLPDRGIVLGETPLASGPSPPAVTIVDAPDTPPGLWIDLQNSDIFGDAYFKWSVNDGSTWSDNVYTGHNVDLGNGFVVDFAEAAYNADNLYKATVASWTGLWGYTASQATASKQPVYSSVAWDGHPCLMFDGVDDILVCSEPALVAPYQGDDADTAIAAAHDASDYTTYRFPAMLGGSGSAYARAGLGLVISTGQSRYFRSSADTVATVGSGRRHELVTNTGTAGKVIRNGVVVGEDPIDAGSLTLEWLAIGGHKANTEASFHKGKIAAVLLGSTCSDAAGLTALLEANGVPYA